MTLLVRDGWTSEELRLVGEDLARTFPLARAVVDSEDLCWGGTQDEADALLTAIHYHDECWMKGLSDCCQADMEQEVCSAHELLDTQTSMDHLLNVYRNRGWYRRAEWAMASGLTMLSVWSVFLALNGLG